MFSLVQRLKPSLTKGLFENYCSITHARYYRRHLFEEKINSDALDDDEYSDEESDTKQDMRTQKKKAFQAIMKKKFSPKEHEDNLLTWAAKEQIKHLNDENPEEWTVPRIAESFPIKEENVIFLLKSSYVPKSIREIIKHDKKVHRNWQKLKDQDKSGPIGSTLLLKSNRLTKISAANGLLNFPLPKMKFLSIDDLKPKQPGDLEKIVKEYCEKNKCIPNTKELTSGKNALDEVMSKNSKLLQEISNGIEIEQNILIEEKNSQEKFKLRSNYSKAFSKPDNNLNELDFHSNLLDKSSKHYENNEEIDQVKSSNVFLNVNKHHSSHTRELIFARNIFPEDASENETITSHDDSNELKDIHTNENHHNKKILYDEKLGYQYPYGKKQQLEGQIKINKKSYESNQLIQKGKDFFNENGEFLYRVP